MKLGALLSQNLRKGTKGLADALRWRDFTPLRSARPLPGEEERRQGPSLLLPMFLMLAVVLVIVIGPGVSLHFTLEERNG